jgi:hypothetical protein
VHAGAATMKSIDTLRDASHLTNLRAERALSDLRYGAPVSRPAPGRSSAQSPMRSHLTEPDPQHPDWRRDIEAPEIVFA